MKSSSSSSCRRSSCIDFLGKEEEYIREAKRVVKHVVASNILEDYPDTFRRIVEEEEDSGSIDKEGVSEKPSSISKNSKTTQVRSCLFRQSIEECWKEAGLTEATCSDEIVNALDSEVRDLVDNILEAVVQLRRGARGSSVASSRFNGKRKMFRGIPKSGWTDVFVAALLGNGCRCLDTATWLEALNAVEGLFDSGSAQSESESRAPRTTKKSPEAQRTNRKRRREGPP